MTESNPMTDLTASTSTTMAARNAPLTLIVAMTSKAGIGKDNALPWPMLKKEMAYFARVTQRVPSTSDTKPTSSPSISSAQPAASSAQNIVIMGRKTWDGIPAKFRPLKNRTNIVLTRSSGFSTAGHDDVVVASRIKKGLDQVDQRVEKGPTPRVGRVFVIGGASIYAEALKLDNARRVLVTDIEREVHRPVSDEATDADNDDAKVEDYDCDTYFPVDVRRDEGWEKLGADGLKDFTEESFGGGEPVIRERLDDETITCRFNLYQKK